MCIELLEALSNSDRRLLCRVVPTERIPTTVDPCLRLPLPKNRAKDVVIAGSVVREPQLEAIVELVRGVVVAVATRNLLRLRLHLDILFSLSLG